MKDNVVDMVGFQKTRLVSELGRLVDELILLIGPSGPVAHDSPIGSQLKDAILEIELAKEDLVK